MAKNKKRVTLCNETGTVMRGSKVLPSKVDLSIHSDQELSSQEQRELEDVIIAAIRKLGYRIDWMPVL